MSERDSAIRDRAIAKSLVSNAFTALCASHSPSNAARALAGEVRALDPEAERTDKNPTGVKAKDKAQASSSSFADPAKQLAKHLKERKRLEAYLLKLNERIASCSMASAEADASDHPGNEAVNPEPQDPPCISSPPALRAATLPRRTVHPSPIYPWAPIYKRCRSR